MSISGLRTRWAAIGAACAVTLGAGGIGLVSAVVTSGARGTFVPVTPTRVLDTRNTNEISESTYRLVIEGIVNLPDGTTRQIVPTDATAVSINLTVTNGRKNGGYGYVTAFECMSATDPVPEASAINFENSVDIANALNLATSSNGSICLYVHGSADLIVDVNGYYADHNHDDRYYTESETNTLINNQLYFGATGAFTNSYARFYHPTQQVSSPPTVVIGDSGNPMMVWKAGNNLWISTCLNPLCTRATHRDLGNANIETPDIQVVLTGDGNPSILGQPWISNNSQTMTLIRCNVPDCSSTTSIPLDEAREWGQNARKVSMTTNGAGNVVIAYWTYSSSAGAQLRLITCMNHACSTFSNVVILNNQANTTGFLELLISPDGNPIFVYNNGYAPTVLACLDTSCSNIAAPKSLGVAPYAGVNWKLFALMRADGRPVIYAGVKVFDCADSTCSTWTSRDHNLVNNGIYTGYLTVAAVSPDGQAYFAGSYGDTYPLPLWVIRCENPLCSEFDTFVLDKGSLGIPTSIAFGLDGNPVFSYRVDYDMALARWAVVEPT